MTDDTRFDAAAFAIDLGEAGQALIALAEGPGQIAADVLRDGFARAGAEIEAALLKAAESGRISFDQLFEAILADLARLAAETVLSATGLGEARGAQAPGIVFNIAAGADAGGFLANQGRISQSLIAALSAGGRFR